MADFQGMTVAGKFCPTAREAAARAGVSTQAIYARAARGWRDGDQPGTGGRPPSIRDITFRGRPYPDVAEASTAEGVSRQAVYEHLRKTGQIGGGHD